MSIKTIDEQIAEKEQEIKQLKLLKYSLCSHTFRDESYVNGHNGNDEFVMQCTKCPKVYYYEPDYQKYLTSQIK